MDFRNINFSQAKSEKRINKAKKLLGTKVVNWIIGFALFLQGARRKDISQLLDIPYETFNSFIPRIWKDGINALEDRRFSPTTAPVTPEPVIDTPTVKREGDEVIVHLSNKPNGEIRIPCNSKAILKAVLLTLMQNKILDSQMVAGILGCTQSHVLSLNRQILSGSPEVLFGNRQGQKQCYIFNPEVTNQLLQQYCANVMVGESTSSKVLASNLKERYGLDLSDRSIRYHVKKLGLKPMAKGLVELIEQLKKNSGN